MRTPLAILAGSLALTACVSGTTRVVYVPTPAPSQAPAPAARPAVAMPPVGVTLVRADERRLLVSTNQPAYLAVFEIVPNRGVSLIYPASAMQRRVAMSGSNWLPVAWRALRADDPDGRNVRASRYDRDARGYGQASPVHYVYAIASDRPLRLTDGAFDDARLRAMLGARVARAADPYETMTALVRQFVPPVADEEWGEDLYTMDVTRPSAVTVRVAKVYCPDGSITYVREDMIERAACAYRERVRGGMPSRVATAPRPDSVVGSNGRPVKGRLDMKMRTAVFRVQKPRSENAGGRMADGGRPAVGHADAVADGNPMRGDDDDAKVKAEKEKAEKEKSNNGNHYGWDKGNGNNGNNGNAGRMGVVKGRPNDTRPSQPVSVDVQQQGKPEHPSQGAQPEAKPEHQPEAKPEHKPEAKPEHKPEAKPEHKPEHKPEVKPEPEQKQEHKPEAKPEVKPEPEQKAEVKPEPKPEPKPEAKPEHKPEAEEKKSEAKPSSPTDDKEPKGKPGKPTL